MDLLLLLHDLHSLAALTTQVHDFYVRSNNVQASAYCLPVPVPKMNFCILQAGIGRMSTATPYRVRKLNPKTSINQSNCMWHRLQPKRIYLGRFAEMPQPASSTKAEWVILSIRPLWPLRLVRLHSIHFWDEFFSSEKWVHFWDDFFRPRNDLLVNLGTGWVFGYGKVRRLTLVPLSTK